jgi:hypothetical protein
LTYKPIGGIEMKANISMEIYKEDLEHELQEVIRQIAGKEIKEMVKVFAEQMVKEAVGEIVKPIVDEYLEQALVGREHVSHHEKGPRRQPVDGYIKRIITDYLDEPVYRYSEKDNTISGKYARSSSVGSGEKTRAEMWIIEKTRKFADTELFGQIDIKLQDVASKIIPSEEKLQLMIREEVKARFS